jgi:hypothetical protein
MATLMDGLTFTVPDVDLSDVDFTIPDFTGPLAGDIEPLTTDDLTTKVVDGDGVFDALMSATNAHIAREFDKGRITGAEYARAYVEMIQGAMGGAVQFLLGRDQAKWAGINAQMQARLLAIQSVTARVELETAKLNWNAMVFTAKTAEANYALTKMKLAGEDVAYSAAKYQVTNILPAELAKITAETNVTTKQGLKIDEDILVSSWTRLNLLPSQKTLADNQSANVIKQSALIVEQTEAQRAQTMNTRIDGVTTITGVLGKQKDLYTQQIASYQRDAEVKAAKLFTDAWTVQKTIDEGLTAPTGFTNASLDTILTKIKTTNALI